MSSADSVRLILGVDGGGTSTTAWLAHSPADVVGIGRAGPSNAKAIGIPAARQAVSEAIVSAFSHAGINRKTVDSACLGLAGFDRPEDRNLLDEWNKSEGWSKTIVHANDGDLVVAAGTPDGWGIGVIAGTGSIAVGRDRDGKKTRAGGWGSLIGDEGSAYSVVLAALRMVARRADGRDPLPTGGDRLGERLCEALGVDSPARIVSAIYAPGFDRARIAGLAPVVLATLSECPEIDMKILARAGADLAEMVIAVCPPSALIS